MFILTLYDFPFKMVATLRRAALFLTVCALQNASTSAFTQVKSNARGAVFTPSTTAIAATPVVATEEEKNTYGEISRQYRRTVYTHEEWVKHRSSNRFARNLSSIPESGIFQNISREVLATTTVAAFVVGWNAVFGDYQDLSGVTHAGVLKDSLIPILTLPLSPFTLLSPSLGLLLGKFNFKAHKIARKS